MLSGEEIEKQLLQAIRNKFCLERNKKTVGLWGKRVIVWGGIITQPLPGEKQKTADISRKTRNGRQNIKSGVIWE